MTELPVIRRPGPEDARAAAKLHHRSWVATYGPLVTPREAEREGRVVGLVEWEIGPEGDRAIGEVHAIHVAAEERGGGVGEVLLVAALDAMRSLGVRRAVLWVLDTNSAARRF